MLMKKATIILVFILLGIVSCYPTKNITQNDSKISKKAKDTVRISNDSLEYEVIIIDVGFTSWMAGRAKPRGFYSETYLENRNRIYVPEWNSRVLQPDRYDPKLYEMQIDYDNTIHYGYEVNYLLYNYFVYFQEKYKQNLAGFTARP